MPKAKKLVSKKDKKDLKKFTKKEIKKALKTALITELKKARPMLVAAETQITRIIDNDALAQVDKKSAKGLRVARKALRKIISLTVPKEPKKVSK